MRVDVIPVEGLPDLVPEEPELYIRPTARFSLLSFTDRMLGNAKNWIINNPGQALLLSGTLFAFGLGCGCAVGVAIGTSLASRTINKLSTDKIELSKRIDKLKIKHYKDNQRIVVLQKKIKLSEIYSCDGLLLSKNHGDVVKVINTDSPCLMVDILDGKAFREVVKLNNSKEIHFGSKNQISISKTRARGNNKHCNANVTVTHEQYNKFKYSDIEEGIIILKV